jgi:hypothetical protein
MCTLNIHSGGGEIFLPQGLQYIICWSIESQAFFLLQVRHPGKMASIPYAEELVEAQKIFVKARTR